jgi:hypothetical protein
VDWDWWRYIKNDNGAVYIDQIRDGSGNLPIFNGGETPVQALLPNPIFYRSGDFTDLRWSQLLEDYFQIITDSLARPYTVTGWFNIGALDFYLLDGLQAVYVPQFGANFYVNKFDQWRYGSLVRLTLVKIEI